MATETGACDSCQAKSSFPTVNSEKDLQDIFRKLRVNNAPKKLTNLRPKIKCTRGRSKSLRRLPEKSRKRKLLRDPTFIFTRTNPKTSLTGNRELAATYLSETKDPKEHNFSTVVPSTSVGEINGVRLQGCGEQFRNGGNFSVTDTLNMDDTTPEELASYFDQLLHIPKPMSQMAEMMYT